MKEQYIGEKLAFGMVPAVCIGSGADIQSFASVCLLSATIGHRGQRGIAWQRRNPRRRQPPNEIRPQGQGNYKNRTSLLVASIR